MAKKKNKFEKLIDELLAECDHRMAMVTRLRAANDATVQAKKKIGRAARGAKAVTPQTPVRDDELVS